MRRIVVGLLLSICAFVVPLHAQYDASLSQYFMAKGYYNPAYAGSSSELNLTALSRLQWLGIEGAPQSFFVAADMPFSFGKTTVGGGLVFFKESIGLFDNTHVSLQGSYKQKLLGGVLSGGIQIGMISQSFDGTKVETPDSDPDPSLPLTQTSGSGFDISAGFYYTHKHFFLGIGASHLNQPVINMGENMYTYIAGAYNFMGGYNIKLKNSLFELQPSFLVLTDLQSWYSNITARVEYNKMFNGGVFFSPGQSAGVLLGAKFGKIQVGYVFDVPTTSLVRATTGSHELAVRYKFRLKKRNTGKNRHKSVRIL